jgi:hypothetical protein
MSCRRRGSAVSLAAKHWQYRRLTLLSVELETSTLEGYHGGRFRAGRAGADPSDLNRGPAGYEVAALRLANLMRRRVISGSCRKRNAAPVQRRQQASGGRQAVMGHSSEPGWEFWAVVEDSRHLTLFELRRRLLEEDGVVSSEAQS